MEAKFEVPEGGVEVIPFDAPSEYEMVPRAVKHKGDGLGETALGEEAMRGEAGTPPRKSTVGEEQPYSTMGRKRKHQEMSRGCGGGGGGGGDNFGTGRNVINHVISVNPGEDVSMAVIRFALKVSRAVCVLSGSGEISSVTLCQQDATTNDTYEGRFEIMNLSGCFKPLRDVVWSGEMSVTMAARDGRILGGRISGQMRAASLVQVVVAVF